MQATINGHNFRTTTTPYGGVDYIGLNREARDGAGVGTGRQVTVELRLDDSPREVDAPPKLAAALCRDVVANQAFEKLSYTHRKEDARSIAEAKRDETRERRLTKAVEMLRSGVRTPG